MWHGFVIIYYNESSILIYNRADGWCLLESYFFVFICSSFCIEFVPLWSILIEIWWVILNQNSLSVCEFDQIFVPERFPLNSFFSFSYSFVSLDVSCLWVCANLLKIRFFSEKRNFPVKLRNPSSVFVFSLKYDSRIFCLPKTKATQKSFTVEIKVQVVHMDS